MNAARNPASDLREVERSVTVFKGRGGMTDDEQDILFCVVTRLEIGRIRTAAHEIDPSAFIVVHSLADAEGGV
ncbi:MAG: YitT family protein, partial [Acidobacteriota bacterium]